MKQTPVDYPQCPDGDDLIASRRLGGLHDLPLPHRLRFRIADEAGAAGEQDLLGPGLQVLVRVGPLAEKPRGFEHDIDPELGPFLVMERLVGEPLSRRLGREVLYIVGHGVFDESHLFVCDAEVVVRVCVSHVDLFGHTLLELLEDVLDPATIVTIRLGRAGLLELARNL